MPKLKYDHIHTGWYKDLKRKFKFRSGIELRFAALLRKLELSGTITHWEYESKVFYFSTTKSKIKSYLPDFKVYNNDGTIVYYEVKGRNCPRSRATIYKMKKYYPEIKIVLVKQEFFDDEKNAFPSFNEALILYGELKQKEII